MSSNFKKLSSNFEKLSSLKSLSRWLFFFLTSIFLSLPPQALAVEIVGPDVSQEGNNIVVSTSLILTEKELRDIKNGISKELTFYIDLFRVWKAWPDEFVIGKAITRTLTCDDVKKEYIATSFDGMTLLQKRFNACEPLIRWSLKIQGLKLTNIAELASDDYFVKVIAESRLRRLPPVIGYLFFFVKEKEFSISKNSSIFSIGKK